MIQSEIITCWNGKVNKPTVKQYKISLCISCMDRLEDLRKTLPVNIEDNKNYPNLEFVLLDYNSSDGLSKWVKTEMMEHINTGKLVYYRTEEPEYFEHSHSHNVAFKLATGDIVNNLDADNYTLYRNNTMPDICFGTYLNMMANQCEEKAIFANGKRNMHGRCGFYKKDFIDVLGGYDENIKGYGYEDHDIVIRAWYLGFVMYWWGNSYCNRLWTQPQKRNKRLKRNLLETKEEGIAISQNNIRNNVYKANMGKHWGKARVRKNFTEDVET